MSKTLDKKAAQAFARFTSVFGRRSRRVPGASTKAGRKALEKALCALADYEGEIKDTLCTKVGDSASEHDHSHVCAALRILVDGDDS